MRSASGFTFGLHLAAGEYRRSMGWFLSQESPSYGLWLCRCWESSSWPMSYGEACSYAVGIPREGDGGSSRRRCGYLQSLSTSPVTDREAAPKERCQQQGRLFGGGLAVCGGWRTLNNSRMRVAHPSPLFWRRVGDHKPRPSALGVSVLSSNDADDVIAKISKTVPFGARGTTYATGYSTVTNQVSGGITPAPTYDGNGNQLTSTPAGMEGGWRRFPPMKLGSPSPSAGGPLISPEGSHRDSIVKYIFPSEGPDTPKAVLHVIIRFCWTMPIERNSRSLWRAALCVPSET